MRGLVLPILLVAVAAAQDKGAPGLAVEPLAPDPVRDVRIEELIDQLRQIDEPYDGITCTSGGGVGFDALRADEDTPPAFRELVRLGPAAMPALLKHVDDKRETKLTFKWVVDDLGSRMFARKALAPWTQGSSANPGTGSCATMRARGSLWPRREVRT